MTSQREKNRIFLFVLIQDSSQHFSPEDTNPGLSLQNLTSGGPS